eukprot:6195233-Pleurochrysis_carterae.AAC.5
MFSWAIRAFFAWGRGSGCRLRVWCFNVVAAIVEGSRIARRGALRCLAFGPSCSKGGDDARKKEVHVRWIGRGRG